MIPLSLDIIIISINLIIRIYGAFETLNDLSMKHKSKNGKTTFKTGHKPTSFEIIVVSDIYIEGYTKVEDYYITTYKNEGLDSANVFIDKISQLEEQPGEVIQKSTIAKINIE